MKRTRRQEPQQVPDMLGVVSDSGWEIALSCAPSHDQIRSRNVSKAEVDRLESMDTEKANALLHKWWVEAGQVSA